nr:hypothetical protein [Tanacetum cinerariifolium]
MKSIQTFLEKFICIPFEEKPQILFQAWEFFFAIQYSKPEDPNELFQKLLRDLKELAEYENSQSRDRPIFLNDDEDHSDQNKESLENYSNEIATSNSNHEKEEPPQDSDIRQLIEECSTEVSEEQKQSLKSKVMRECYFVVERDAWLRGEFTLSSLDVLQGFSFFLQIGLTLILATLDGLDVGLLGDVIGENDCDDDG